MPGGNYVRPRERSLPYSDRENAKNQRSEEFSHDRGAMVGDRGCLRRDKGAMVINFRPSSENLPRTVPNRETACPPASHNTYEGH